ncbi:hypothetical protein E3N88_25047 [Mikania micrantha]|uniref:Uncharacterized protein n=1 Tax=Mikania micrantha TaxID=192012 RepID=A0A5N6N3L8_9ASTR|nr:hypothetical protein E3N88_25047 [Mikania micrantha]
MADGTRARVMEESLKGVQDDQKVMRQELNTMVTAISSLQTSINELIKRSAWEEKPKRRPLWQVIVRNLKPSLTHDAITGEVPCKLLDFWVAFRHQAIGDMPSAHHLRGCYG